MSKRRRLKGIAYALAKKFVSRNSNIGGYWALGIIYSCTDKIVIDFLQGTAEPNVQGIGELCLTYRQFLENQLTANELTVENIKKAEITLCFNQKVEPEHALRKWTWGEPFTCTVDITHDLDTTFTAIQKGWCGKHDPEKERSNLNHFKR